jgi:hypothetical protein
MEDRRQHEHVSRLPCAHLRRPREKASQTCEAWCLVSIRRRHLLRHVRPASQQPRRCSFGCCHGPLTPRQCFEARRQCLGALRRAHHDRRLSSYGPRQSSPGARPRSRRRRHRGQQVRLRSPVVRHGSVGVRLGARVACRSCDQREHGAHGRGRAWDALRHRSKACGCARLGRSLRHGRSRGLSATSPTPSSPYVS